MITLFFSFLNIRNNWDYENMSGLLFVTLAVDLAIQVSVVAILLWEIGCV